jgi:hypothetical protein
MMWLLYFGRTVCLDSFSRLSKTPGENKISLKSEFSVDQDSKKEKCYIVLYGTRT